MFENTKLLVFASLFFIISGFIFLWFGLRFTPGESKPLGVIQTSVPSEPPGVSIQGIEGERAWVVKVVDGDTIELANGKTVRFLGVDTPETVDPKRPVGCFGKEASNETKRLLSGKEVILQKDVSDNDKYGRLLRYVYLPLENGQTLFVNDYLVRVGFARVLTYPPDTKFDEGFRRAEGEAKQGRRGLWGYCGTLK